MLPARRIVGAALAAAVLATSLLLVGGADAATLYSVQAADFQFTPQNSNVAVGDTVVWTVSGGPHTITSDSGNFDSGSLSQGQVFSVRFNQPGSYAYHCQIHPGMVGEIRVTDVVQSTTTTSPPTTTTWPRPTTTTTWQPPSTTTTWQPTTTTTWQPPTTTTTAMTPAEPAATLSPGPRAQPAASGRHSGYAMVTSDGIASNFGDAPFCGNAFGWNSHDTADIDMTPDGKGYWILQRHGYVDYLDCGSSMSESLAYEHNNFFADRLAKDETAVSLSAVPDGTGYWVFTDKGRVIPFGKAPWLGDMGRIALSGPVLGSVATPTGKGYWMVASDGGIFSFGDATFHGSTGNIRLNQPVMSMAPAPDGSGYWLVASDGGIFAFDVPFYGSMGATKLNKPISGIIPGHAGYMMVAQDGGIFSFGDVPFAGSLGAHPPTYPVVAATLLP